MNRMGLSPESFPTTPCNILPRSVPCFIPPMRATRNQPLKPTTYKRWERDNEFIESLKSNHVGEKYEKRIEEMKEEVMCLLEKTKQPIALLELIDSVERLGVGYHFKKEIKEALAIISTDDNIVDINRDLHATSLRFRLLRQHRFEVSQDVFNEFKDEMGEFKTSLRENIEGLLNLYEASFLGFEGETLLDEAREFSIKHLKDLKGNVGPRMKARVDHALELPYHWRTERIEARWFIESYVKEEDKNPLLFELAKLDYNMVQALYQKHAKALSRWWKNLDLAKHFSSCRSAILECCVWGIGFTSEPKFGYCRETLAKVCQLGTTIDDFYDVYGSFEELELFTDAVDRWDVKAIEQLPQHLQICFLALFNTANEMGYDILSQQGIEIIDYLRRSWTELCEAQLAEAKWRQEGHTPTLDEYLNVGWITPAGPNILNHVYFFTGPKMTKEALQYVETNRNLMRCASTIFKLLDDLESSTVCNLRFNCKNSQFNDKPFGFLHDTICSNTKTVPYYFSQTQVEIEKGCYNCIACYMKETGTSEAIAREHAWSLINENWKKINKETITSSSLPDNLVYGALGLARWTHYYYQHADGLGIPNYDTENRAVPLLAEPICVN